MDAAASGGLARRTRTFAAYGEVVWSWRRDRGVYPARLVAGSATVTINAAHRGEHEANRQTIARGSRCDWLNSWWTYWWACFSLPSRLRVHSAPGFPCALSGERDNEMQNSGEFESRE